MQFREGADVVDTLGESLGTVDRIVINPQTKNVTHVVVRKGPLLPEDKVFPVKAIQDASKKRVVVQAGVDFDGLPQFESAHYIPWTEPNARTRFPAGYAAPYYWYPPAGFAWWRFANYPECYDADKPPYQVAGGASAQVGATALEEGMAVISADNEVLGRIGRFYVDPVSDRITHLVITEASLFDDDKLIPTAWVTRIQDSGICLSVDCDVVKALPAHTA